MTAAENAAITLEFFKSSGNRSHQSITCRQSLGMQVSQYQTQVLASLSASAGGNSENASITLGVLKRTGFSLIHSINTALCER